jgi:two-component system response regulator PilR (NtrC family)
MQVKLLRVIQQKSVRPVGAEPRSRWTCASSAPATGPDRDGRDRGAFRQDLFYRINVIELNIPPLRERPSANSRTSSSAR